MSNKEKYLQLAAGHTALPLFFQPWWLDHTCAAWDIAFLESEQGPQAVFPYQVEKKMGLTIIRNPLLTPYLGPLFLTRKDTLRAQWDFEEKALQELWRQFPRWDYFQLETVPGFMNFLPFHTQGFSNTNRLTYHLDLKQPEATLFSHIHTRRRTYIRKAMQEVIVEAEDAPDVALFTQWHKKAFEAKKRYYPYSVSFFQKIIQAAQQHGASLFLTAKNKKGMPLAMLWMPYDRTTAYHLLGAYNPGEPMNGAMDALVWTAIREARAKGLETYDFEGSMDKGIESFFRKFGGERKIYLSFQQNKSRLWKLKKALLG